MSVDVTALCWVGHAVPCPTCAIRTIDWWSRGTAAERRLAMRDPRWPNVVAAISRRPLLEQIEFLVAWGEDGTNAERIQAGAYLDELRRTGLVALVIGKCTDAEHVAIRERRKRRRGKVARRPSEDSRRPRVVATQNAPLREARNA